MYVKEVESEREWEAFLQASLEGTIYHSLKWKEVIQRSFSHRALYLTISDENGRLIGICPGFIQDVMHTKIFYSMPYSDYGGPVIARHCAKRASLSLQSFLENFCSSEDISYGKFCFMNDDLAQTFKSPLSYVDKSKGTVEIDLKVTPSSFIWNKALSKSYRRKIRLIERHGFQAHEARTKSDLRVFYDLYYRNMKYIGASPYPYEFMENMWNVLYPENLRIWLLEKKRRIAGILVLKHGRRTYWVYAGIDRKQCYRQYSVIPYLVWKEIRKAEEEGRRCVSLGGTPSDPRNPYYIQKMSFGGIFYQQEMVWYPLSFAGRVLLQTRNKAVSAWKTIRNFLPTNLKSTLESKLSKF